MKLLKLMKTENNETVVKTFLNKLTHCCGACLWCKLWRAAIRVLQRVFDNLSHFLTLHKSGYRQNCSVLFSTEIACHNLSSKL